MEKNMRCSACKYEVLAEHNKNWTPFKPDTPQYIFHKGDQLFYPIKSSSSFTIDNPNDNYDPYEDYEPHVEIKLFGCPKCNTVRFEVFKPYY